ncbi:MAG: SpoIIE family protein phosphatase [Acidobacteria bacterium]|nr:SpoIIE family protein phosphatase [Acidobacteriota bacterium]
MAKADQEARALATAARPAPAPASLDEAQELLAQQARAIDRLHFLVEASKMVNSTLDLPELLSIILNIATRNTNADRGTLFLVDHANKQLWSVIAHGLEEKEIRLPMGRGIAGTVAEAGEVLNLADAYTDTRFDRDFDRQFDYRTRSLLCLPIKDRDEKVVGVLELLNKRDGPFTGDDIEFLESLSVHFAIALENARLHRESLERQRMERELTLARGIQEGLLPDAPPHLDGLDIAVRHQSSLQVGGDYYDFLLLDPRTMLFVVADVEGKGVASALMMSNLQAMLRALVMHVHALEGIAFLLNEHILEGARSRKFMTMFLGLVDLAGRGLHYINAGHIRPAVIRREGEPAWLSEGGLPIGLFPDSRYERGFLRLESGDVILTCTDGIVEADNAVGDQFGSERMVEVAHTRRQGAAQEIVEAVFAEVADFARGGQHSDDKVMMAIKVR